MAYSNYARDVTSTTGRNFICVSATLAALAVCGSIYAAPNYPSSAKQIVDKQVTYQAVPTLRLTEQSLRANADLRVDWCPALQCSEACEIGEPAVLARDAQWIVQPGDDVEIAEGAMRGLRAVVSRVMRSRERVAVLLEFLGRQTTIEVPANFLVKEGDIRERAFQSGK